MWGCSEMHSRNNPSAESHLGIPRMLSMRFIICLIGMSNYFRKISMIEGFHHLRTANVKYRYIHPLLYSVTTARATTLSTSTTLNSKDPNISITDMNLVELKVLLKQLGGSPGTLRKADILALCKKLSQEEQQSLTTENTSAAIAVSATLDEAKSKVAKRNVRALKPILDGPNSMEMFQLPVIKGDIDSIGSNIVQDLSKIYSEKSKFGSGGESNLDSDYIMPPTAATRKGGNKTDGKTIINSSDIENPRSNSTELESVTLAVTEPVKSSSIREYTMGVTYNTSGSTEVRDLATGQHYWSHHPTGAFRDDRLHEGPQPIMGITAGGPGSGMGDMDITFLGTASCIPSLTRGVSCLAYRCKSDVWLFDCGEGSQQQMQKSRIKPSKINKIFITHLHGDHSFGLPGVLCLIGQSTMAEREKEKLLKKIDQNNNNNIDRFDNSKFDDDFVMDIYGPEGTRDFLRAAIQLTYSKVVNPYRIHELKNVPDLYHKNPKYRPPLPQVRTRGSTAYGERPGGLDIYPDESGHYFLFEEGEMRVQAAPVEHTVPCVGYVITEKTRPGRLRVEDVVDVVNRNKKALAEAFKLEDPNKIFAVLKAMKPGSTLVFPDGTVVNADDILELPRSGRKIVIMGDTCNSDILAPLAMNADIIVHEATNAWIRDQDSAKHATEQDLERETLRHGHSTPQMAARFLKKVNGKKLIMTHFSSRYRGDDFEFSMKVMWRFEHMARRIADLWGKNDVIAAWDHMCFPVRTKEDEEAIKLKEQAIRDSVDALHDARDADLLLAISSSDDAEDKIVIDSVSGRQ